MIFGSTHCVNYTNNIHYVNLTHVYNVYTFLIFPVAAPILNVSSTTSTSIKVFWMSPGPEVDSYVAMWVKDTSGECSDEDMGNATFTDGSTCYNITKLEEDSNYTITVMANNVAGSEISNPVTALTEVAGEEFSDIHII